MTDRITQATNTPAKVSPVRSALKSLDSSGALGRALPTGISPQRFNRIILTELSKNAELEKCSPPSVLGAVMTAAQLGLEFGPLGHAYLVPYKQKCTLIIGYKGYIDLARRSGQLKTIVARPVHQNDEFDYNYGTDEYLRHKPALTDRGPVIAYYGVATFTDGGFLAHVMSPADVEVFRARSAMPNSPAWKNDYHAMAQKTVIRRMVPWLPMTVEAAQAFESDETVVTWDGSEAQPEITTGDESVSGGDDDVVDAEVIDEPAA